MGGQDQTANYMDALRDTMKGLVRGTVVTRAWRPQAGDSDATSGRHCIFFEADDSRVLVVRVLHDRMDYRRHLGTTGAPTEDA
jgi:plasmid stabilization system protein ParE